MARWIAIIVVLVVLASCGSAGAPAVPSAIDLEPLLVQSGDLPAGVTGAQVRDVAPKMFDQAPKADRVLYQQFASGAKQIGGVAVFLYKDADTRTQGYSVIAKDMGQTEVVAGLGDQAVVTLLSPQAAAYGLDFADVLFQRCVAVVHVRISGPDSRVAATAYAKRLDKRPAQVVC